MARKKNVTKQKMTKTKPSPEEMWVALCSHYEDAQKKFSTATHKAFVKGKLPKAHVAKLSNTFEQLKKVKKKMKKFLKKYA